MIGTHTGERWTVREDDYLRVWYSQEGIPPWNLANDLGRTVNAVRARIRFLDIYPPARGMTIGRVARKESGRVDP